MKKTAAGAGLWQTRSMAQRGFGQRLRQLTQVSPLAEYGGRLVLAVLLASAQGTPGSAPFLLGFVAASGAGPEGFCALVGAAVGTMTRMELLMGLRCLSAAILIFAVSFAFCDLAVYRSRWFMPLLSAGIGASTGLIYLSRGTLAAEAVKSAGAEFLLVGLSALLYRMAVQPWKEPGLPMPGAGVGLAQLFSLATVILSLSGMELWGWLELGMLLAAGAVLLLTGREPRWGLSAAVVLGLVLELCPGHGGSLAVLTSAGLLAGMTEHRLPAALLFITGGSLAGLMAGGGSVDPGLTAELAGAGIISLLLPEMGHRARDRPEELEPLLLPQPLSYTRRQLQSKLLGQAAAYQRLYEDMRRGLSPGPLTRQRLEQVFDRAAEQVCQNCPRYALCWKQDYHQTYQAIGQLLSATQKRGFGRKSDVPPAFQSRCSRLGELISAANGEYAGLLQRRQMEARLRTSRGAVWQQYDQLARLLKQAAMELEDDLKPDPDQAQPAIRFLRRHGLRTQIRLGRDGRGRLVLQLFGGDLTPVTEGRLLEELSRTMGVEFCAGPVERDQYGQRMTLVQEDRYLAKAGVAALARDGQSVSGDGGTWFRDRDGILWVLLCDGMGSGAGAACQSRLALKLLEDFLRAGTEPEQALRTLSGALALRGEEELGFTTIDLMGLDLFSGQCRSYKLGAAPSYLRQNRRVKKLAGSSLPAGAELGKDCRPDVCTFRLEEHDLAVLVSDGVSDGQQDDWLWKLVRDHREESPRQLAAQILEQSDPGRDDRTVLVLQMKRRPSGGGSGRRQQQQQQSELGKELGKEG